MINMQIHDYICTPELCREGTLITSKDTNAVTLVDLF